MPSAFFVIRVPALPFTMSTISDKEPITASFPVCFAKLIAACTFGPMEPEAKPSSEIASGEATEIAF